MTLSRTDINKRYRQRAGTKKEMGTKRVPEVTGTTGTKLLEECNKRIREKNEQLILKDKFIEQLQTRLRELTNDEEGFEKDWSDVRV